uniref:tRNA pseudouridine synthase A n=1 Tax=uncultured Chloroflexi bacterium Rifle_16ft_4_minimus_6153 TaxID=1665079 RepID=A0A0H4T9E8_9CHLR|nr:tRNA pseudouridine synthase A, tRNA pseudouridine38-40 synthase [uncultured Chloroflexi bacterium Rifle_16ft_4_minimus_6153]
MARYRAVVEYDGTEFLGFQRQAEGLSRTVQGEIEAALGRIGWTGKAVLGAGRTDSGVHASGQVIAFDFEWRHGSEALLRALNANLPPDAAIKALDECAADFHPRYAAKGRRYRYTLYNAPVRSPLAARYAWHVWPPALNVEAMQAASQRLVGRHDFAAFGADPDGGESTTRTVRRAEWAAQGEALRFEIQADAFLYRMVRSLVGALKKVGAGDLAVADFVAILQSRDRAQCPPIAPPQGLCLVEVIY